MFLPVESKPLMWKITRGSQKPKYGPEKNPG